ncbi:hypothetical protein R5R35_003111 [Gryllus longicercus]|uniref:Lariat debranching enzyme C-terminal domain-containing protein n=1 Tax=Gryllus longicercus TaxID=2509291 RepID=A0AAN9Z1I1_9ORTH
MKIAIEGCAHGQLEIIYDSIKHLEEKENVKIDLLICCGDFQATRNLQDLKSMAVPPKYQSMCSFYKYYSGEKQAPVLTVFIGGNHEASNHLQELPYGGWAAPNIYYMGYANVINIAGVRIAGLSGIYKGHDYMKGRFEKPPYSEDTKRSVYHVRNLDVFRLKQLQQPVDVFLSHDWPRGVHQFGDENGLLKLKPFFREDITTNSLGSKPCEELLHFLKPTFWFSAHLHVKFAAVIPHDSDSTLGKKQMTKFLALDKCLPKRKFLQVIEIPHDTSKTIELEYDLEWLAVLHLTNHLLSVKKSFNYMPGPGGEGRWKFSPTSEELDLVREKFGNNFLIPKNFIPTVKAHLNNTENNSKNSGQASVLLNPQTITFCTQLGIDDPLALLLNNPNESFLSSSSVSSRTLPSSLTPERSGDFTSFNDSSELSVLGDTSISELSSSFTYTPSGEGNSTSPLSARKSSLVLPSPRNSIEDSFSKECEEDANESSKFLDGSVSQESDLDDLNNSCDDGPEASPESKETCDHTEGESSTQPKMKKFRRRNEAIYSSADEDY